jgi:hypothetical protein
MPTDGSLPDWLTELVGHRSVPSRPSRDPTLRAFGELFAASGLAAFAAGRRLRVDAYTLLYDCWTESTREPGGAVEVFTVAWAPNRQGVDPLAGFRTGEDSILLGTAPTVAMPQDERTEALLLLVTSSFLHLSAERGHPASTVRGVQDTGRKEYVLLELADAGGSPA